MSRVGGLGVLASWPDAEMHDLFDGNVFGSLGGSITQPFMGPYTMSKRALEACASCLRQELAPHGAAVSIVQPGAVATAIGDNGRAGNVARLQATPPPFADAAASVLAALQPPSPPRLEQARRDRS